jgi:hypothetical protein
VVVRRGGWWVVVVRRGGWWVNWYNHLVLASPSIAEAAEGDAS